MRIAALVLVASLSAFGAGAVTASAAEPAPSAAACSPVGIAWNAATKRGPVGRRQALEKFMTQAEAGDAQVLPCLADKVRKDLKVTASTSTALQGHAPLLKMNRDLITAASEQSPARRCRAFTLFEQAWKQFYTLERPDLPALIGSVFEKERPRLCP